MYLVTFHHKLPKSLPSPDGLPLASKIQGLSFYSKNICFLCRANYGVIIQMQNLLHCVKISKPMNNAVLLPLVIAFGEVERYSEGK